VTRFEAWLLHLSNLLVGGTGLVYAWMRYLAEPADEFAIVNHPLQPTFQHAHILVAPLLVFGLGLVWRRHVATRVLGGHKPRRTTGLGLALTVAPMVASGYLLQTAESEGWRTAWIVVHLVTSGLWLAAYGAHLVKRRYAVGRPPAVSAPPAEAAAPPVSGPASSSRSPSGTRG
jgi:hypothetical protein